MRSTLAQNKDAPEAIRAYCKNGIGAGIEATGCGIAADNTEAIELVMASSGEWWWELTADDVEVKLALAVSRN